MNKILKIALPIVILVLAVVVFKWMMANKPEPKKKQKPRLIPVVRTVDAEQINAYRYQVSGYGTVEPAREVSIVSEVTGKVIWQNEKMKTGGKFKKGEGLYRVDDTQYKAALDSAVATLKNAQYELKQIEEQAAISMKEWEIWNSTAGTAKKPSTLVTYEPQLEAAKAKVQSAESAVVSSKSDLAKVLYKAPFDCVVTEESIEHGKIIRVGESAGTLVGSENYEVYVPVSAKDAVRLTFSEDVAKASDGYIELAEGKNSWKWPVYAERVLPGADESTGMLQAVMVVPAPFDTMDGERPILPIGASVRSVVKDKRVKDMIRIPDEALREGNIVWVLFNDSVVQIREVHVVEKRGDFVFIDKGVAAGEKVIVSAISGVVDGMTVNTGKSQQPEQTEKKGMKGKGGGAQ